MGLEMLDILAEEGVDPAHVVVGHCDRNADPWYHAKIAERGATVQFDGVSKVKYQPDSVRIDLIRAMIAHGHVERLLVSGDMGRASYLAGYGGGPGFAFIASKFIPRLLDEGVEPDHVTQIFERNPVRWLAQF